VLISQLQAPAAAARNVVREMLREKESQRDPE
jgi:hypothetical protein